MCIINFKVTDGGGGNGVTTTESVQTTNLTVSSKVGLFFDIKPTFSRIHSCEFRKDSYDICLFLLSFGVTNTQSCHFTAFYATSFGSYPFKHKG